MIAGDNAGLDVPKPSIGLCKVVSYFSHFILMTRLCDKTHLMNKESKHRDLHISTVEE